MFVLLYPFFPLYISIYLYDLYILVRTFNIFRSNHLFIVVSWLDVHVPSFSNNLKNLNRSIFQYYVYVIISIIVEISNISIRNIILKRYFYANKHKDVDSLQQLQHSAGK